MNIIYEIRHTTSDEHDHAFFVSTTDVVNPLVTI